MLGLSVIEFASLTWRQYVLKRHGFNLKRSYEFEHTRAIVFMLYTVNTSEKDRVSMHEFWPLMTDDKELKTNSFKMSLDEKNKRFEQIRQLYKKENDLVNAGQ